MTCPRLYFERDGAVFVFTESVIDGFGITHFFTNQNHAYRLYNNKTSPTPYAHDDDTLAKNCPKLGSIISKLDIGQ